MAQVIIDLEEYNRLLELEKQFPVLKYPGKTELVTGFNLKPDEVELHYSFDGKTFNIGTLKSNYPIEDLHKYFTFKIERRNAKL